MNQESRVEPGYQTMRGSPWTEFETENGLKAESVNSYELHCAVAKRKVQHLVPGLSPSYFLLQERQ